MKTRNRLHSLMALPFLALPFLFVLLMGCGKDSEKEKPKETSKAPLTIAYSDWPGWLVWEIGNQKDFFKEAGVDVKFEWGDDYGGTIDSYSAKAVDAINIVCGDSLTASRSSTAILLTDYSNGNDKIIGKKGITSFKELKGKKIGLQLGLVEHILFDQALKDNGMTEQDVKLEDVKTESTPQALASGGFDAVGAWYPITSQALQKAEGSKPLYTSEQAPGLIYDALQVSPESLITRRDEWKKVVGVWFKCLDFLNDPKTHEEAIAIMAKKIKVPPAEMEKNLKGTKLLDRAGNLKARGEGYNSRERLRVAQECQRVLQED